MPEERSGRYGYRTAVLLPVELVVALDRLRFTGPVFRTRSAMIREAIEEYLETRATEDHGS